MATLPTVPSFTFEEAPSISVLNQLAYCVTFLNVLPAWAQAVDTSQSIASGGAATALSWTALTDRDGGFSGTTYTAQTPGYYLLSAGVAFASASAGVRICYFQVTTGSGNPGGSGNTTIFGDVGTNASPTTATRLNLAAVSPYLYAADQLQVFAFQSSGSTLSTGTNTWSVALQGLGP